MHPTDDSVISGDNPMASITDDRSEYPVLRPADQNDSFDDCDLDEACAAIRVFWHPAIAIGAILGSIHMDQVAEVYAYPDGRRDTIQVAACLSPKQLRDRVKWDMDDYYAPYTVTKSGANIGLYNINGRWVVITSDGQHTGSHSTPQLAVLEAKEQFGLAIGNNYNIARLFAAHEREAGWPTGWVLASGIAI